MIKDSTQIFGTDEIEVIQRMYEDMTSYEYQYKFNRNLRNGLLYEYEEEEIYDDEAEEIWDF
jgi:hypothetical protein